ncbi:uncharacterized protein LOC143544005 [Bidens hawaiensis]|uniref:uncharacterized protein LOC143544005 n=1 Tax=Bidens hawaiensis TaxID=980011 RepID=UPI004049A571
MAGDKKEPVIQPKASGGISLQVSQYKNAREIWAALKAQFVGAELVQKARLLTLKSEFEKLKMAEDKTVDQFAGKITGMVSKATGLGHVFEQDVLVMKLLDAVPDKYFNLVASIEQTVDLDSMSYKGKSYDQSGSRGKGWPSSNGRGRGRETGGQDREDKDQDGCQNRDGQHRGSRYTGQRKDRQWRRKDMSQVQCFRCDEFGHFASSCPERDQKTVFLNEDGVIPKCFETEPMEKDVCGMSRARDFAADQISTLSSEEEEPEEDLEEEEK